MTTDLISGIKRVEPDAARLVEGDPLDMWHLYQMAASKLAFYDTLPERKGLLFPDFFKAIRSLLKDQPLASRSQLETELEETFSAMHNNWSRYGPFFRRHPELHYLKRHHPFGFALPLEMADNFPSLRSLRAHGFWSLEDYRRLRGNLDAYVLLDEELLKQPFMGTLFEKDPSYSPGTVFVYLQPDASESSEIAHYLRLLKHGSLIGFCSIALAEAEGKNVVVVTSLQTDLLRKDRVTGMGEDMLSTTFFPDVKPNGIGEYTVPRHLRRPFLENYAWAQKILGAVEEAALSKVTGIEAVMVPTTSYGVILSGIAQKIGNAEEADLYTERPLALFSGDYAKGVYDLVPGIRGYHQKNVEVSFPLTGQTGRGTFWIATVSDLKGRHGSSVSLQSG